MTNQLLLVNLGLVVVYMSAWFVVAYRRRRLDTVDSAWSGGFVLLAWAVYIQKPSAVGLVLASLVSIWGARLMYFLVRRSGGRDEDPRYKAIAKKWRGNYWLRAYLSIFLLQAVLIWLVALPLVFASGGAGKDTVQWLVYVGTAVWLAGFVIEAVADKQLSAFLADKSSKGKNMDRGLWKYSRHPNYFGELLQWWAIGIIALQAAWGWLGLAGPLLLSVLVIFVSGIPPIENRRRDNPEYQTYKRRTSMLIPLPPRH